MISIRWVCGHVVWCNGWLKPSLHTILLKDKIRSSGNNIPSIGDSGFTLWIMHPKRLCLRMIPSFPGGAITSRFSLDLDSGKHIILVGLATHCEGTGSFKRAKEINEGGKSWNRGFWLNASGWRLGSASGRKSIWTLILPLSQPDGSSWNVSSASVKFKHIFGSGNRLFRCKTAATQKTTATDIAKEAHSTFLPSCTELVVDCLSRIGAALFWVSDPFL